MHQLGIVAVHDIGRPTVTFEKIFELLRRNSSEHRGIGDLVAVEMQDRQDSAIADGI